MYVDVVSHIWETTIRDPTLSSSIVKIYVHNTDLTWTCLTWTQLLVINLQIPEEHSPLKL